MTVVRISKHNYVTYIYRTVLHHCEVIFFWSSGIMECVLITFENRVQLMRYGTSVVWYNLLPLINSFNKTEAAGLPCRLCFLRDFPFISFFNLLQLVLSVCVTAVQCHPVLHHRVVIYIMEYVLIIFENRVPLMS